MANKHNLDRKFIKKHQRTGSTEGGACLNRHIWQVTRSSCSYRFQARERAANDDSGWYNFPAYKNLVGTQLGARFFKKKMPTAGSWDVKGKNFKKANRPYYHQSHHILPNGVLNDCIEDVVKRAKDKGPALRILIRGGLLEAKYNLNHKTNMIILPMTKVVSHVIKLPIHVAGGMKSHAAYSATCEVQVNKVMRDFARLLKKATEDHPENPGELSRAKLEQISNNLRRAIRAWGTIRRKEASYLDAMTVPHIGRFG
jgi:hypothetical protein